jgi:hypothetical protein
MIDDFTSWRRVTDNLLWQALEPRSTDAEAARFFETGLAPQMAVKRLLEERAEQDAANLAFVPYL